jgi:hypothetical protein
LAGCGVTVRDQKRPLIRHDRIRGEIEGVVEHRTDKQESGPEKRESRSNVFEERLRLETTGDVYHPDFLNYDVMVGAGLAQQNIESDEVSGWSTGELSEYQVSAQILRTKPYSGTVNASKTQDLIPRQFLSPLWADHRSESAAVVLRPESWPMTFQYSNSEVTQEGFQHFAPDFFSRDEQRLRYSVDHDFSKFSHMHFDFDRTDATQETVGAVVDTDTNAYNFSHDFLFGQEQQHRLDSLYSYIDQGGSFEYQDLRLQERLRLQHTPNFLSRYDLQYDDLERDTLRNQQIRGQAGIEHRLFESLVTNADAFASQTELGSDENLFQYGGIFGLNYRKMNPWGTLFSSYAANFTRSDQTGGAGRGVVVGEAHTATDVVPIELDRTNIDISTIRVRTTGGLLYQPGDDYTISQQSGRVFLTTLVVGGAIPPNFTEGQDFLVDYEFFVDPERQKTPPSELHDPRALQERNLDVLRIADARADHLDRRRGDCRRVPGPDSRHRLHIQGSVPGGGVLHRRLNPDPHDQQETGGPVSLDDWTGDHGQHRGRESMAGFQRAGRPAGATVRDDRRNLQPAHRQLQHLQCRELSP